MIHWSNNRTNSLNSYSSRMYRSPLPAWHAVTQFASTEIQHISVRSNHSSQRTFAQTYQYDARLQNTSTLKLTRANPVHISSQIFTHSGNFRDYCKSRPQRTILTQLALHILPHERTLLVTHLIDRQTHDVVIELSDIFCRIPQCLAEDAERLVMH